jgi:hypothetical protein
MAVVINEFEIVPAPAPSAEKGSAASAPKRQEPDPANVVALIRLACERAERVRAH